jgi:hypothetical protein
MIRAFGLFIATYVVTGAITYGLSHTPVPWALSYAGYVCDIETGFYPFDGLAVGGLIAGFLSAYLLRRILTRPTQKTIAAIDPSYMWKMMTLVMLGGLTIYRAYLGLTSDCGELMLADSRHTTEAYSAVYSVINAAIGYLFFDLRRYRFPIEPWRPR